MLLSGAVAAGGTGSAATEPVVSEAALGNASPPAPVRMPVGVDVCGSVRAPTDSAIAEATSAAAISAVADHETTRTARSLPQLRLTSPEWASQPPEVSLSDRPLSRASLIDFPKPFFGWRSL
jgi:hypothetical protein